VIITRYHKTETLQLTVEFLTPTFLGGADQNAEWWRVAVGSRLANHTALLQAEGDLFGSVLDENQASASRVRLALTPVEGAFLLSEKGIFFGKTPHPEVKGGMAVENALYLGFGPITLKNSKRYIAPGSKASTTSMPLALSAHVPGTAGGPSLCRGRVLQKRTSRPLQRPLSPIW